MSETLTDEQIQQRLSDILWSHAGRTTVGFVHVRDVPSSLGSGTLIRFGNVIGVLTCAHVLKALLDEDEIGILCFPVRPTQIQRLRVRMSTTDNVVIGAPPWSEGGPDLAFLRLPGPTIGEIGSNANFADGEIHRQNILAGEPEGTRKLCAIGGVVAELTKPAITEPIHRGGIAITTAFEALLNVGNLIIDDHKPDRFRFQPVTTPGVALPTSYGGTSGAGLWKFYVAEETFSLVQSRLIGVVYFEKPVGHEMHIIGHAQRDIYETLLNAMRQKWG